MPAPAKTIGWLICLLPALSCLPAAEPSVSAALLDDAPPGSVALSPWSEPPAPSGWRLHRAGDGQRELTQHWLQGQAALLRGAVFAIQAGARSPLEGSALDITLTRASADSVPASGPGPLPEVVFSGKAALPANTGRQAYRRGRWLALALPPAQLEAGRRYALHLAFAGALSEPQEIVFAIAPLDADDPAFASGFSQNGAPWKWWREKSRPGALLLHLVTDRPGHAPAAIPLAGGRTLRVDPRDPEAFPTLRAAAAQVRAGDTLWLAPGSGPYREELYITASGTPDAPVVIEGNGNEITGFDPLRFNRDPDGKLRSPVAAPHPFVLRHQGKRVPEDASARRFSGPVAYDADARVLTLAEGVSPEGWEISVRTHAVRLLNVSHHRYRNLVASGARNDGFNLHGRGEGLVFEDITGRDNLDEGFSAHGHVACEINGGRFFGNDNGVYNIQQSSTRIRNVDIYDNLGIGLCVSEGRIEADHLRIWGNGMLQATLQKEGVLRGRDILVYRNEHPARPWVSYMESARWTAPATVSRALADTAAAAGIRLVAESTPTPP